MDTLLIKCEPQKAKKSKEDRKIQNIRRVRNKPLKMSTFKNKSSYFDEDDVMEEVNSDSASDWSLLNMTLKKREAPRIVQGMLYAKYS